jgi:hypothetical protein
MIDQRSTSVSDGYTMLTVEPDLGGRVHLVVKFDGEPKVGLSLDSWHAAKLAQALLEYTSGSSVLGTRLLEFGVHGIDS